MNLPNVAKMAMGDFADAEEAGNKKVATAFKKIAKDWGEFLSKATGSKWRVEAGDYVLSLTSPLGKAIDVMWDYDPGSQKVDITVEGPKRSMRVFSRQSVAKFKDGKKTAPEFLTWLTNLLGEARGYIVDAVLELEEADMSEELKSGSYLSEELDEIASIIGSGLWEDVDEASDEADIDSEEPVIENYGEMTDDEIAMRYHVSQLDEDPREQ